MSITEHSTYYEPWELMLHRRDMLLIDSIDRYSDDWIECSVYHDKPSLFADDQGRVPAWVGLEYMCQAVAAMEGVKRVSEGDSVLISFIIGIKRLKSSVAFFYPGQKVSMRVDTEIRDTTHLGVFLCTLSDATGELMSCRIKGVMPENANQILERQ